MPIAFTTILYFAVTDHWLRHLFQPQHVRPAVFSHNVSFHGQDSFVKFDGINVRSDVHDAVQLSRTEISSGANAGHPTPVRPA